MKLKLIALAVLFAAFTACADVITYDFTGNGGAFDFQSKTGSITTNGIIMSFEAFALVGGELDSGAELNAASGSFGVNNSISGDNTSRLNVNQWITIAFSVSDPSVTSIYLQTVTLGIVTSGFSGYYQIDGESQVAISSKGDYVVNPVVNVMGKNLTVAITAGAADTGTNGAVFQGITVETIPEPATLGMIGLVGLLGLAYRRLFCK